MTDQLIAKAVNDLEQAREKLDQAIQRAKSGELTSVMAQLCDANQSVVRSLLQNETAKTVKAVNDVCEAMTYADTLRKNEVDHHYSDEL